MGFGFTHRLRRIHTRLNLLRFNWRKNLLGFDVANLFLQRADKDSLRLILRKNGAIIGSNCDIETGLVFHNCMDYSNLIIGDNCHIGKACFFDLKEKVEIGNNVVISMQCTFITHIDMARSALSNQYPSKARSIQIGNEVYLGANVTVLMGVHIGRHALVAAKSLVRNDVDPKAAVAGIPAKPLMKRQINR